MHSVTTREPRALRYRPGWRGTVIPIAVLTGLLLACAPAAAPTAPGAPAAPASAGAAASPAAQAAAKAEPQGSVTIVLNEEPISLASPDSYSSFGYPVLRNVGEALTNRDPKTNELVGELATSWEQPNPTTWRFHLRQGVKFHDGSPFNAEAAAFGINLSWSKEKNYTTAGGLVPSYRPSRSTSTPWTW